MKNQILINELNIEQNKQLVNEIKRLKVIEEQIKVLQQQYEEVQTHIINSGFDTIGIQDLNIRIAVVTKEPIKTINYKETLKDIEDITPFQIKEEIVSIKETWNVTEIEKQLGDKVVYEIKQPKPYLKVSKLKGE